MWRSAARRRPGCQVGRVVKQREVVGDGARRLRNSRSEARAPPPSQLMFIAVAFLSPHASKHKILCFEYVFIQRCG